jgi:hypothetical protein
MPLCGHCLGRHPPETSCVIPGGAPAYLTVRTALGLTKVVVAPSVEKAEEWAQMARQGFWGPLAEDAGRKVMVARRPPSAIPNGKPRILRMAPPPE